MVQERSLWDDEQYGETRQQAQDQVARAAGVALTGEPAEESLAPGHAELAMRLAMRIGDVLLSAGMSANDVVVVMLRIAGTYGLRRVSFDVSYTSISATYYPALAASPITATRVVQLDIVDTTKVQNLSVLYARILAGMPVEEALAVCEQVREAPPPYPWWVATAANAGVGVGVALLFTTSWKILLITFVTGCIVDRVLAGLRGWRVPTFFQQIAGAGLITLVAGGVTAAAAHGVQFFAGVDPTLVVVGGIVMLVAGMMFVSAAQDAIDEFYVTATARILETLMRTAGIVIGIVVALSLARYLGAPITLSVEPVALGPLPAQYIGATLTSAFSALLCYASPATTALSAAMGALGWAGYTVAIQGGGGEISANALGALAAALVSTLLVRKTHVPGFALVSAALIPLVPGLALYTGLIQVVGVSPGTGDLSQGAWTLFQAAGVALGIAAGASFGAYLGRPVAEQIHGIRVRTRVRRRQILRRRPGSPR